MSVTCVAENTSASVARAGSSSGELVNGPLGWMALWSVAGQLRRLSFGLDSLGEAAACLRQWMLADETLVGSSDPSWTAEPADFVLHEPSPLAQRLLCYAQGNPDDFADVAVSLDHCTPFQRQVIAACRKIGYGQTSTYLALAAEAGSPRAARAVGNVMATNRVPLVVPCHRILASGGALGGYSMGQGLAMKRRLLMMEAIAGGQGKLAPSS